MELYEDVEALCVFVRACVIERIYTVVTCTQENPLWGLGLHLRVATQPHDLG